jgi:hypothetical protein
MVVEVNRPVHDDAQVPMIPRPDFYPAEPSEVPGPDLFMTVIKVRAWQGVVDWYVGTLGLLPLLRDDARRFVLLAAGTGRLAIQGDDSVESGGGPHRARLVFVVPDVEAERVRLGGLGVSVGAVREDLREHYREIRIEDPAGTPITLFSWTSPGRGTSDDQPPE